MDIFNPSMGDLAWNSANNANDKIQELQKQVDFLHNQLRELVYHLGLESVIATERKIEPDK
jgi:conjugal transfer/entry exclusion protein